jgi:hypothetical protein
MLTETKELKNPIHEQVQTWVNIDTHKMLALARIFEHLYLISYGMSWSNPPSQFRNRDRLLQNHPITTNEHTSTDHTLGTHTVLSANKECPPTCNSVPEFLFHVYMKLLNMFRVTPAHHREPKTALTASGFAYLEGCWTCSCWTLSGSFRLLMMGGVSPETCWASHKYETKFWYTVASCWIFFVNYTVMHGSTNIKFTNVTVFFVKGV